jgi:2-dehydropantoate 2-reductase
MNARDAEIVVYGTGAIGATVGGWLTAAGRNVTFIDRPEGVKALREQGLRTYLLGRKEASRAMQVKAVADVSETTEADIVVLAVKNYDLEAAARDIQAKMKREPVIVALQNGLDNQSILPKYFSKVVYAVVCYNAWRDGPGVFGYQHQGPIYFGVTDRATRAERDRVVSLFSTAFPCRAEERLVDAVQCKMVINLVNSIAALVGLGVRKVENVEAFKQSTAHVLFEGMQILQKAGVREVRLEHMINWRTIRAGMTLPGFLTTLIFKKNVRTMKISSMGQDVYLLGNRHTEIESLNGYFVKLAESVGFDARYNKALYRVAKEAFAQADFRPMDAGELWARLQAAGDPGEYCRTTK